MSVQVTRIPMGRNRQGKAAKWTSSDKEEEVAIDISNGLRCSSCTKEFTFEENEEVIIPRPEHSSITYHKNCWPNTVIGWPDWD